MEKFTRHSLQIPEIFRTFTENENMLFQTLWDEEQLEELNDTIKEMTKVAIKESADKQMPFVHDPKIFFYYVEPEDKNEDIRYFKVVVTVYTVVEQGKGFNKDSYYFVPYHHTQEFEISVDEYLDLINFTNQQDEQPEEND